METVRPNRVDAHVRRLASVGIRWTGDGFGREFGPTDVEDVNRKFLADGFGSDLDRHNPNIKGQPTMVGLKSPWNAYYLYTPIG